MTTAVLDARKLPRTSWRNGTGATRVVGSGRERGASWRVSIADIDGPCRFSRFPDTWRWSLVTSGTGLTLSVDGLEIEVPHGEVVEYGGESVVEARPFAGSDVPVEVLNLMVTPGRRASMDARRLDGPVTWSSDVVAVLVLDGTLTTEGSVASAGHVLLATKKAVADRAHCVEMAVGA